MIIQVVARKVGEDAAGKLQTADALLRDRVGADFHECVFASGVCHLTQQAVKGNRIGSGVLGWNGLVIDVVAYGGNQSDFIPEITECII